MTMVHNIEAMIISTLETQSPISAERRTELISRLVELIHIEPGTSSDLIHSHLTADLALYTLEQEGEVATTRNAEGALELSLVVADEQTASEVEPSSHEDTPVERLGTVALSAIPKDNHTLASL